MGSPGDPSPRMLSKPPGYAGGNDGGCFWLESAMPVEQKDGESVSTCQNAKKVHNATGGRRHGCMKSLHTLTFNGSVKSATPGSDYSTSDGEMPIAVVNQGVFSC